MLVAALKHRVSEGPRVLFSCTCDTYSWAGVFGQRKGKCPPFAAESYRIHLYHYCSVTLTWIWAGCSNAVSKPGFISTSHLPENSERKPACKADSQLDRKWSREGVRGLLGMIYASFRNAEWVQGRLLLWELTEWARLAFLVTCLYSLNGNTLNVKIVTLLPHVHLTWNFQYIKRQTKKEMNHSLAPICGSCQRSDSLRPDWVGQLVGSWLPSKSEKLWCASSLRRATQSRSFPKLLLLMIRFWKFVPV